MGLYTNHCNLLDLSALNFQAGFAAEELPFGITSFAVAQEDGLNIGLAQMFRNLETLECEKQTSKIAVCGLHMRGLSLEHQLTDLNAVFVKESKTAAEYKLYKLPTSPIKPGLVHVTNNGYKIDLEVWEMPTCNLGAFLEGIPAPLGLGKIKLEDGTQVIGFLCEDYITGISEDISEIRSFRKLI
jgi:allophanate hydrolase